MGKVILIASGKGGTGKTMLVVNMGVTLSEKGNKVLILDMDMGLRNLDLYLGIENRVVYDVYDVMTGRCRIKQATMEDKRFKNLSIIASPPKKNEGEITPLHMKVMCDKLKKTYDYILIDGPSGIEDGLVIASAGADEVLIITSPEYAALRDAEAVDRYMEILGISDRHLIINKVRVDFIKAGYTLAISEISSMFRIEIIGIIQYDDNINISTNVGIPIVCKKDTYISNNFKKICANI